MGDELLDFKIAALDEKVALKLDAEAREREFHQVETEQRFNAHGTRLHDLETGQADHETRILGLETKDTKAKADTLDKGKAWLIGVLLTGASGWVGLNWEKLFK